MHHGYLICSLLSVFWSILSLFLPLCSSTYASYDLSSLLWGDALRCSNLICDYRFPKIKKKFFLREGRIWRILLWICMKKTIYSFWKIHFKKLPTWNICWYFHFIDSVISFIFIFFPYPKSWSSHTIKKNEDWINLYRINLCFFVAPCDCQVKMTICCVLPACTWRFLSF